MDKSELPENIADLIENAKAGNVEAQFELGQKYRMGQGVEQSNSEAFDWYRRAAEQGYYRAQNALGVMYKSGLGVEQSYSDAITWYHKAIEQEFAPAMLNLANLYRYGQGVEQSYSEAISWYHKAIAHGYAPAMSHLGDMYKEGRGVEQNYGEALIWYRKAAELENPAAQNNLGWMYQNGRGVEQNESEAITWYRKAAEQEYALAQHNLGWAYMHGQGVEQNDKEAIYWYSKAADQGEVYSQFNLGLMYLYGLDGKENYAQAQKLFNQAAASSDPALRFKAIEYQDQAERYGLSPIITDIRKKILRQLRVNIENTPTMTHYTSLSVGSLLLLDKSPLRLGHINALNDPNEGKLLWRYLGHPPVEGKPVFVGCFLPDDDSLNMWRFYSKNHQKDDACGCAISFDVNNFFDYNLLKESQLNENPNENSSAFSNTGKSPQESATFYRIVYISDNMNIRGDDAKNTIKKTFSELKKAAKAFLGNTPDNDKLQQLSRLLGPLPYLLKDADYEAEKEHRIIITHLEYGAKEIQSEKPILENGVPPRLYLELHRASHLDPVKHVTLGPKAPHQEMMIPYWHHKLMSEFADQLKPKKNFYIKASKCAYQ